MKFNIYIIMFFVMVFSASATIYLDDSFPSNIDNWDFNGQVSWSSGRVRLEKGYNNPTNIINVTTSGSITPDYWSYKIECSNSGMNEGITNRLNDGVNTLVYLYACTSGKLYYNSGGLTEIMNINSNTEYTIEVKNINYSSEKYDVWVNGTEMVTGISFFSSGSSMDTIKYEVGSLIKDGDIYFDDVCVASGETCTVASVPRVNITNLVDGDHVSGDFFVNSSIVDSTPLVNCSLYINQSLNKTEIGLNNTDFIFNVSSLVDGSYNLNVTCTDSASNIFSDAVDIVSDSTTPIITINQPQDMDYFGFQVDVNVTIFDKFLDAYNISFYNSTGQVVENTFRNNILSSTANITYQFNYTQTGAYTMEVCARDSLESSPKIEDDTFLYKTKYENYYETYFDYIPTNVVIRRSIYLIKDGIIEPKLTDTFNVYDTWTDEGRHLKTEIELDKFKSKKEGLRWVYECVEGCSKIMYKDDRGRDRFIDDSYSMYFTFDDVVDAGYNVSYHQDGDRAYFDMIASDEIVSKIEDIIIVDPISGGLNTICSNQSFIASEYTSLNHFNIDIVDTVIDSPTPILVSNTSVNISQSQKFYFKGSMNIKSLSPQTKQVYLRIDINGVNHIDEVVRTVTGTSDVGLVNVPPFFDELGIGTHSIELYFYEIGNGAVEIQNFELSAVSSLTTSGEVMVFRILNNTFSSSNTSFEILASFPVSNPTRRLGIIDFVDKMSTTGTDTGICKITDGIDSPLYYRYLSGALDTGSSGVYYRTDSFVTSIFDFKCKTLNGQTISHNVYVNTMSFVSNTSKTVYSRSSFNTSTSENNTLLLGAGRHRIANVTHTIQTGEGAEIVAYLSAGSTTGEQTPEFVVNVDGVDLVSMPRYLESNDDIGTMKIYSEIDGNVSDTLNISLFVDVGVGETVELYDESLTSFDTNTFDISSSNVPPIVIIDNPENASDVVMLLVNGTVTGNFLTNASIVDLNGDSYLSTVTLTGTNSTTIATDSALNNFSVDYTGFVPGLYTITWNTTENETSELFSTVDVVTFNLVTTTSVTSTTNPVNTGLQTREFDSIEQALFFIFFVGIWIVFVYFTFTVKGHRGYTPQVFNYMQLLVGIVLAINLFYFSFSLGIIIMLGAGVIFIGKTLELNR